jgi:hypothetical protein
MMSKKTSNPKSKPLQEPRRPAPEGLIGRSSSSSLWTTYMFELMGITSTPPLVAEVMQLKSSKGLRGAGCLELTETLRRALERASISALTKVN